MGALLYAADPVYANVYYVFVELVAAAAAAMMIRYDKQQRWRQFHTDADTKYDDCKRDMNRGGINM